MISSTYNPLFDKYSPFHDLFKPYRIKCYYGGRAGMKSWVIAEALIRIAAESSVRVLATRELMTSISDSSYKLLCDTISRLEMDHLFEITKTTIMSKSGSQFIFKGVRFNYREIKSLEGLDIVWCEESGDMSDDSWQIILPTVRKEGSEIWISFNTGNETDATYRRFVETQHPHSVVHFVNYWDNPFLSSTILAEIEHDREVLSAEDFDNIWNGKPRKISNAVIFKDKYEVSNFELPYRVDWCHGVDFGFSADPTALTRCFVDYDANILYIDAEVAGYGIENDDMPTLLKTMNTISEGWKAYGDSSRPETIKHLEKHGINIEAAKKWAGSVNDGIYFLKSFKKIVIRPTCVKTIEEFSKYSWKVDRISGDIQPVPVDKHNHHIDSIRYALNKYITHKGTSIALWEKLGRDRPYTS